MEQKAFNDLIHKVDEIHRTLLGSEHEKDIGVLARVQELEKEVDKLKQWRHNITYFAYGAVIPASYGMYDIIREAINHLAK